MTLREGDFHGSDGYRTVCEAWARAWIPRPPVSVSAWAEQHRRLSGKSAAEPGPWRNERIPYLKAVMDALSPDHPAWKVVLMKSAQVGATECALNWVGCTISDNPAPMLVLFPTEKLGQRWSRTRLQVMIEETPILSAILPSGRKNDNTNTLMEKDFPDGHLYIGSANIPTDLASTPIQYILLDEVDRFPAEIENEGDPVELAIRRTATWNTRRKVFENSTPTIESLSRINRSWQSSSQNHLWVPCPHCNEYQTLEWDHLRWPEGEPEKAAYICSHNGCVIEEHHKAEMLAASEWRPTYPEREGQIIGFHINCLYTPIGLGDTWAQNAHEFEVARPEPTKLKVFTNTRLGKTEKDAAEKIEWKDVWERREEYPLRTPGADVLLLTCGVDVQKDYLAVMTMGWGEGEIGTVVDWIEKPGDPTRDEVWEWLDEYLQQDFVNVNGAKLHIAGAAIDSGYQQHEVTNFTRQRAGRNIFATKGSETLGRRIIGPPTMVDVNWRGKNMPRGAEQYQIGVSNAKTTVYNRLRADAVALPEDRHWHFAAELGQEFFIGLCAEVFDPNKRKWVKIAARNEPLDCTVLNIAAALHHKVQIHRYRKPDWERLRRAAGQPATLPPEPPPAKAADSLRLSSGFMPVAAKVKTP